LNRWGKAFWPLIAVNVVYVLLVGTYAYSAGSTVMSVYLAVFVALLLLLGYSSLQRTKASAKSRPPPTKG